MELELLLELVLRYSLGPLYHLLSESLGGIGPVLLGTLILMVLTTAIGIPIAFFVAVLVTEYPYTILAKAVNIVVRTLLEIPTVLVGMLVYSLVVVPMGRFSAIAGAIALAMYCYPTRTRIWRVLLAPYQESTMKQRLVLG